jgi:prolycopene isomerase
MYISVFPDLTQAIPADINAYHALLKELYPAEAANIDALFTELDGIDLIMTALEKLQAGDMSGLTTILANLQQGLRVLSYINMTLKDFVAKFTTNQELTGVFEQLCTFLGAGPGDLQALYFLTMWNGYHRDGYYYLRGGSQAISDALAAVFVEHGGVIKYNTLATKIVVQGGQATQVQTLDDACFNMSYVVSNANAPDTLLKMIGEANLPADYVAKLKKMTVGPATLQVFLAVDHDYRDLFPGTHEMMVDTTYDFDQAFAYAQQGDAEHVPYAVANYTAIDDTTAPAGKNAITLTTYLPYDLMNRWRWNEDYQTYVQAKEEIGNILAQRAEAVLPELTQHIEFMEVGSPVTNYGYTLNPQGSILGFAATPEQSTLNRLAQQTPIDNVVLAGAWTFPGGGQSAVLTSGLTAGNMVLKKAGKK